MAIQTDIIKSHAVQTPPLLQDSAGTEVIQGCTAWVDFDGHTGVIGSSFNVVSVTRTAVGIYIINFTNGMSTSFYAPTGCVTASRAAPGTAGNYSGTVTFGDITNTIYGAKTMSSVGLNTGSGTDVLFDYNSVFVAIFGGK